MCVYVHMRVCAHVCVQEHASVCAWRPEEELELDVFVGCQACYISAGI